MAGGNVNIVGSDVRAGGDVGLYAGYILKDDGSLERSGQGGAVNVLAESLRDESYHEVRETDYMKGALYAAAALGSYALSTFSPLAPLAAGGWIARQLCLENPTNQIYADGKFSLNLSIGEQNREVEHHLDLTAAGSSVAAGGNLRLGADGDVRINGSILQSGRDMRLAATDNISVTAAENRSSTETLHETTNISVGVQAGDAYTDALEAIKAQREALMELNEALKAYEEIKKLRDQDEASDGAVDHALANVMAAKTKVGYAFINMASASAAVFAAETPSLGTGLYVSANIQYNTHTEKTYSSNVTSVGSLLGAGNDITLDAGHDLSQEGSTVVSLQGDVAYNAGHDLRFSAAMNSEFSSSSSSSTSAMFSAGGNGVGVNLGWSKSDSYLDAITWSNAATLAENGTVYFNVGNDLLAEGYNALAREVWGDIGGDLVLVSRQNSTEGRTEGNGFSLGLGSKYSAGVNDNSGSISSRHTVQSSIMGTEGVNLRIGGLLDMQGSLIAQRRVDGTDGGNLSITARELRFTHLRDYTRSSSQGVGFSFAPSFSPSGFMGGSTNFSMQKDGSRQEGMTYATLGQGALNFGAGDMTDLNRDINQSQIMGPNRITAALNLGVTLDNRLLSEKGWDALVNGLIAYYIVGP